MTKLPKSYGKSAPSLLDFDSRHGDSDKESALPRLDERPFCLV